MGPLDLAGAFVLGFVGGFGHCVGMCAPFVLYVGSRFASAGHPALTGAPTAQAIAGPTRALGTQLFYNLGRTTTYAALGGVAGGVGSAVELAGSLAGVQRAAALLAGSVLVLHGVLGLLQVKVPEANRVLSGLFTRVARRRPSHPYATGLVLGLLPCGLLYSALIAAAATGSALRGASFLLAFAVGTWPALLLLSAAQALLGPHRVLVQRVSLVFIAAMGAYFLFDAAR